MKNKLISIVVLLSLMIALLPSSVLARQEVLPYVFDTTIPIDAQIRIDVDAWLAGYNPSTAIYYSITYVQADGPDWLVCLAALDLASPDEEWSLTEDAEGVNKVVWLGTVRIYPDHSIELLTDPQFVKFSKFKLAAPVPLGGNPQYMFPFETGKSVMYGPRGIHNAGYSTYGAGMSAIDLVSGTDFGGGQANNFVLSSSSGEVDYVCTDGTSVAIRVDVTDSDDKFIYAHMFASAKTVLEEELVTGDLISVLKKGSFTDDCGYAEQEPNHWHLHWGFTPANNAFIVEGCTINTRTGSIKCGDEVINKGGWISHHASFCSGDNCSRGTGSPTFWDYMLIGFIGIFDRGIIKLMPEHTSPTLLPMTMMNMVHFVMSVTYALLVSNFNLEPAFIALFLALTFRTLLGTLNLVLIALRTLKVIPMVS